MTKEQLNNHYKALEAPKFKRLRVSPLELPEQMKPYTLDSSKDSRLESLPIDHTHYEGDDLHEKVTAHHNLYCNFAGRISIDNEVIKEPIKLTFTLDEEQPHLVDYLEIDAKGRSQATVIIEYLSTPGSKAFHNGYTRVNLDNNSQVTLIKLYRFDETSINLDANFAHESANSKLSSITMDLSRGLSVTNRIDYLKGSNAETLHQHIYFAKGESKHDHLYHVNHIAPHSYSKIDVRGAMMDEARKVFRGTLDFKQGSRKSQGSEKEYVLLLNEGLYSHAIPALLCDEDDVEGEHAASAGQIDENQLFYLMSRGFSLEQAKRLLIEANFMPIIEEIPDEDMKQRVKELVLKDLIVC